MGLFTSKEFNTLEDLLVEQMQDLYDAEHRLVDALPKMASAATSPKLRSAFETHLRETRQHVTRLEQAFSAMGIEPDRESCAAMKGLISEGNDVVTAEGDHDVKDAALIAAAQRVEHYEIAGYGSARTFARQIGRTDIADMLQATLDEESHTNELLTDIAESFVNRQAAQA